MQPDRNVCYLWSDVQNFDSEQRWELIDGFPFAMSSPLTVQQVISMQLTASLLPLLRGGWRFCPTPARVTIACAR